VGKPVAVNFSAKASGATAPTSHSTTATSVIKLTQAETTPGKELSCFSTALTHPAHFIPVTSKAIVSNTGFLLKTTYSSMGKAPLQKVPSRYFIA
jgi:hypothetical protein